MLLSGLWKVREAYASFFFIGWGLLCVVVFGTLLPTMKKTIGYPRTRSQLVSLFVGLSLSWGLCSVSADLVWHSALDGNAVALVGIDGVATGTPTATADKNGNVGGAVDFSGGDFFYEIDASPEITSLTAGTMSAWVKWNTSTGEQGILAAGASGGGQTEYFTFMRQTNNIVRVDVDDGDDGLGRVARSNSSVAPDTWYHIVASFTAQVSVSLYVDGVGASSSLAGAGSEASLDGLSTWLIGSERTNARFLNGAIDDVRFYDHELSASEVADLFTAGPLYSIPEPSSLVLTLSGALLLFRLRRRTV
jgi:hypothetical protein